MRLDDGFDHTEPPASQSGRRRSHFAVGLATAASLTIALTACGADGTGSAEPLRSYTLHLRAEDSEPQYAYVAEDPIDLRVGDEVTFEVEMAGTLPHDLQVVAPDGEVVGVAAVANPGAVTSVTVLFDEPGFYRLNCLVDDHLTEHGMQAVVEVAES